MSLLQTPALWVPRNGFPEAPPLDSPATEVANRAAKFVNTNIDGGRAYTAAMAETIGGNCYAMAEAVSVILRHWDRGADYIILNQYHASNLLIGYDDIVWFDNIGRHGSHFAADLPYDDISASEIANAHKRFVLNTPESTGYFWPSDDKEMRSLVVDHKINTDKLPIGAKPERTHVVVSGLRGIEMLHSLGTLRRYLAAKPERYKEVYADFIDNIPATRLHQVPPPQEFSIDRVD